MRSVEEHGGPPVTRALPPDELAALREIERRVLWQAVSIVHAANVRRPNPSGLKVGGHQASSASMVSIMTALWFSSLSAADRVSVKPHASPVLHAINHLIGRLDPSYLTRLRDLGGLQPYPSRTKDPDRPDYSTGSVGLGAAAPVWGAIARRYVNAHFDASPGGRQISLLGDAELDEGAVWECVADPMVQQLGEVLWIVDLNRQSLDRIVPDIAIGRWEGMFRAAGWQVLEAKYGRTLEALFARPGGDALRTRLDTMGNEEFQWLLRQPGDVVRDQLVGSTQGGLALRPLLAELSDDQVSAALRDLGGHDLEVLHEVLGAVDNSRPTVLFAYTVKGRGLPVEGHPANHSALLTEEQYAQLAAVLGEDPQDPWRRFAPESPAGRLCSAAAERLRREDPPPSTPPPVPTELGRSYRGEHSTQATLGRVLTDLARSAPDVAARVVTVSPDVASSTNTGGWINKVGVWTPQDRHDWFAADDERMVRWRENSTGQHIELGIAEVNLVGLLGELGATWSQVGEPLLPIGTIYDPFVSRALEPWSFAMYGGGQSILVGTPSGVTLAAEGGAHQSVTTPSITLEQPGVTSYEPAFAVETEWCLLDAMSRLGRSGGESAYLRLSTRPVDQGLAALPDDQAGREQRRRDVLAGGYLLRRAAGAPALTIAAVGAVVPQALEAAEELDRLGLPTDVVVLTSYDRMWRAAQLRRGLLEPADCPGVDEDVLDRAFPPDRRAPLVTVLDGHPHTLAFLGGVLGVASACLGVSGFGQGGMLDQVYRYYRIDARAVVEAALDLTDR